MADRKKIVIFASGGGSNFISIYNHIDKGDINAKIVLLISNKSNCGAINFAKKHGISTAVIDKDVIGDGIKCREFLLTKLSSVNTDLIVLAGYLKMIPQNQFLLWKIF